MLDPDTDDVPGVLERFLSDIAVDDYAHAPEREALNDLGPRRPSTWIGLAVAALVGLIIVGALLSTRLSTDERQATRTVLAERVQALSDSVAERQTGNEQQTAGVETLKARLLAVSDAGPARTASIAVLSAQAGTTALSGAGVIVSIDDAPDAAAGSLNRVLDRDLQDIVNALWRDGASGVAINGERLTGSTAIRGAGEAILVNYQPLNRPYEVTALGALEAATGGSGVRALLAQLTTDYGLVTDLQSGDLALPAGELPSPRNAGTSPGNGGVVSQ